MPQNKALTAHSTHKNPREETFLRIARWFPLQENHSPLRKQTKCFNFFFFQIPSLLRGNGGGKRNHLFQLPPQIQITRRGRGKKRRMEEVSEEEEMGRDVCAWWQFGDFFV